MRLRPESPQGMGQKERPRGSAAGRPSGTVRR
jgi:hypothetical protein